MKFDFNATNKFKCDLCLETDGMMSEFTGSLIDHYERNIEFPDDEILSCGK